MSLYFLTKDENSCSRCRGFGVFTGGPYDSKLAECPDCGSCHPEQFGMRYENGFDNLRLIKITTIKSLLKYAWENL